MFVLAQDAASGLGSITGLLPILLIGAVFWLLVIRPQRKRSQERQAMLSTVSVGDEVVTLGGLFGEVEAMDDNWVDLLVGDDIVLRFSRTAIGRVATEEDRDTLEAFANGAPAVEDRDGVDVWDPPPDPEPHQGDVATDEGRTER